MIRLCCLAIAGLLALALPAICLADTTLSVSVPAVATDPVSWLVTIVGSVLAYLLSRVMRAVEAAVGTKLDAATSDAIDGAIAASIRWAQTTVIAKADGLLQGLALKNAVAAEALTFVQAHFSAALQASGMTTDIVAAKIEAKLGYYLPSPEPVPVKASTPILQSGAAILLTILLAADLSACTTAQVDQGIAQACQDYDAAQPMVTDAALLDPHIGSTITTLRAYGDSICAVPNPTGDAQTAVWIGQITGQILANAAKPK